MKPLQESPRISILLPVWNAEATLSVCPRSLIRQTETNWECIVVDDGSNDRSLAIANAFAARDPRFRVEARPHEGLISTLNAGIPLCSAASVEVHPRRIGETIGGAPINPPSALATQPPYPIVFSVAGGGPRSEIRATLAGMEFREGIHFVCAA
jgi:hypothetical protein